ncbi:MAG TPA: ROK family protein, partial [Candidatus Tectomicrobia bacterium]|nr:ROK family protein [Candidatus Tectomicrobia bacterium]
HGDCWEGLASAVALRERWGASPDALPAEHPAWPLEAAYLARGLASVVAILAPRCIVLGGGVMRRPGLREAVRERLRALLGDYYVDLGTEGVGRRGDAPRGSAGAALERYLAAPALGGRAGVIGALALASDALAVPRAPA